MENTVVRTKKNRETTQVRTIKRVKIISEDDIRRRAYEIYLENDDPYSDDLDNWYQAERELRGDDQ
jgi:hypothetical protein